MSGLGIEPACPAELTEQQWRVARRIASGDSPAIAAKEEGLRLLTVLEWRYHPAFIHWLRQAREAQVALASAQLSGLATQAISTLSASMTGDNPKVALDAAKEVLRLCGVGPEFTHKGDLDQRRENIVIAVRWVVEQLAEHPDAQIVVKGLLGEGL